MTLKGHPRSFDLISQNAQYLKTTNAMLMVSIINELEIVYSLYSPIMTNFLQHEGRNKTVIQYIREQYTT